MKSLISILAGTFGMVSAAPRPLATGPGGVEYAANEIKVTLRDACACRVSLDGAMKPKSFDPAVFKTLHPAVVSVETRQTCARLWVEGKGLPAHLPKPAQGISRIARKVTLVLQPGVDAAGVIEAVRQHPDVERASLSLLLPAAEVPNDPRFAEQWAPPVTLLTEAWDLPQRADINVAIVDTGVDSQHPEFAGRIIFSKGFADFSYGDEPADRRNGFDHGTHVAGIVAARRGNGEGVAGYSERIRLMSMSCASWSSDNGDYRIRNADDAIEDATANGAHYINCSFGISTDFFGTWDPFGPDGGISSAVEDAWDNHVLVIHSAGNDRQSIAGQPWGTSPFLLNVSATMSSGGTGPELFDFGYSNFAGIYLAAPGTGILSTVPTDGNPATPDYAVMSGTSMAAPQVTGALALVRSLNPTRMQWNDPIGILVRCAQSRNAGAPYDINYGNGRLRLPKDMLGPVSAASAFVVSDKFPGAPENGTYSQPWSRISTALANIPDGGTLVLNGSGPDQAWQDYYAPQTITKACTLTALADRPVNIGFAAWQTP